VAVLSDDPALGWLWFNLVYMIQLFFLYVNACLPSLLTPKFCFFVVIQTHPLVLVGIRKQSRQRLLLS